MRQIRDILTGGVFRPLLARLPHGKPGWLRLAAIVFALVGVFTLAFSWEDLTYSHTGYFGALTEEFEETKGANKGLEAFVLSGLGGDVTNMFKANNVSDEFIVSFNELEEEIKRSNPQGGAKSPQPQGAAGRDRPPATPEAEEPLSLRVIPPDQPKLPITKRFITNTDGKGFLYIPGMVVGAWVPADANSRDIIDGVEKKDGIMRKVVLDSKRAAPYLKKLLSTKVVGRTDRGAWQTLIRNEPIQNYFLTSTGLIRLDGGDVTGASDHYLLRFRPNNFFPERPYFWKTINEFEGAAKLEKGVPTKIAKAFNTTKPYIDYGGNGIVVTLSRPIEGTTVKSGLFLDFVLGVDAEKLITQKVKRLGGSWAKVSWVAKDPEPEVRVEAGHLTAEALTALKTEIKKLSGGEPNLSEISGKLHVVQSQGRRVDFTVPLAPTPTPTPTPSGTPDGRSQPTSGTLLYCELDLDAFQRWVFIRALVIAGSLVASVSCFVLLWFESSRKLKWQEAESRRRLEEQEIDSRRRLEEQQKALESFGQVMSRAPVAYCRLSEDDEFIEMNEAFADLLGYESPGAARESLVNRQTFESLLADDESRREYEHIREMRRSRLQTTPYRVSLRGKDDVVDVRVYGASVPVPKSHPEAVPQTFGILVETGESRRVMSVTPVFGLPKKPSERGDLFVLMKFAREFDDVYKSIEDVARRLKLVATRADQFLTTRVVMDEVWASINAADLIIADCTGLNPNVFYEIGLAHVIGKPVVFLTQNDREFPFDIARFRHIVYELETGRGLKKFEEDLRQIINSELGLGAK